MESILFDAIKERHDRGYGRTTIPNRPIDELPGLAVFQQKREHPSGIFAFLQSSVKRSRYERVELFGGNYGLNIVAIPRGQIAMTNFMSVHALVTDGLMQSVGVGARLYDTEILQGLEEGKHLESALLAHLMDRRTGDINDVMKAMRRFRMHDLLYTKMEGSYNKADEIDSRLLTNRGLTDFTKTHNREAGIDYKMVVTQSGVALLRQNIEKGLEIVQEKSWRT